MVNTSRDPELGRQPCGAQRGIFPAIRPKFARLRDALLAHPQAELSLWVIERHGQERAVEVQSVEVAGDTIYVQVG